MKAIYVQVEVGDDALARWVLELWGRPNWQAMRVSGNGSRLTPLADDAPIGDGDVIGFIDREDASSRFVTHTAPETVRRTVGELDGTLVIEST